MRISSSRGTVISQVLNFVQHHPLLTLLAGAALLAVACWISLRFRPYVACRRCGGTGQRQGAFFRRAYALCATCNHTGLVPRLGTRLLAPAHRPPAPRTLRR